MGYGIQAWRLGDTSGVSVCCVFRPHVFWRLWSLFSVSTMLHISVVPVATPTFRCIVLRIVGVCSLHNY